jgi:hypothetical protein
MLAFGTDLINGAALWKIIVVSLICGAGAAIAFGLLILGLSRARGEGNHGPGDRVFGYALAGICGAFCVAVVVFGLKATIDKPAKKPSPPPKSAALTQPSSAAPKSLTLPL